MKVDHGTSLYFAYGSNINLDQMAYRCPVATVVGPVVLDGYELLFRGNRGGTGVATIAPMPGSQVHGLLWRITRECEQSLDIYEGYPHLYGKEPVTVCDRNGQEHTVMAYIMTGEFWRDPAMPNMDYYYGIRDGFCQNDLPMKSLVQAYRNAEKEVMAMMDYRAWNESQQMSISTKPARRRKQETER